MGPIVLESILLESKEQHQCHPISTKSGVLKLHIVEITPEHEPPLLEEVEEEKLVEIESIEVENNGSHSDFKISYSRTHIGIDPDAHIDLHEIGMELCSKALEETVTNEEAQTLFDKADSKFQEVVASKFQEDALL
ncbi:unnamed protein product [Lactuca saligna]|uniref:Uncharacterized protein n=1 Tax=Lactuca saligna TaxID=75948 RepID=A0AA35V9F2_LACSI|nr:unnamed protein product [Lactuca saligna]